MVKRLAALFLMILSTATSCTTVETFDMNTPITETTPVKEIKVRIIIEDFDNSGPAINLKDVEWQIIRSNYILQKTKLFFRIKEVIIVKTDVCNRWFVFDEDVQKNENKYLNIYYLIWPIDPNPQFGLAAGLGFPPWAEGSNYIKASAHGLPDDSLAHEIGHVFGLRHTFDPLEDIQDTQPETGPSIDPSYNNVMNYYRGTDIPILTDQQAVRMRYWYNQKQHRWAN